MITRGLGIRTKQVDTVIRLVVYMILYNPSLHLKHERVAATKLQKAQDMHTNDSSLDLSLKHKYREATTHLSDLSSMGPIKALHNAHFVLAL